MQTVLITGGAGFIGSHLSKRFLAEGYAVICLDNLLTGSKSNIEPLLNSAGFSFIEHDVTKPFESIEYKVSSIEHIFHLASPASPNAKSKRSYMALPIETMLTNSVGTYNMLELARKHGAKFLYTSTSEIYGNPEISPQPESYFGNVNPNGVRSVYDEAKRFGEALTFAYLRKYDVDTRIVRLFNTYGPYMQKDDGRVVSNFINQALSQDPITIYGEGKQTRSLCFIDDMIEALSKAMLTDGTKGQVINLGSDDERTIAQIAQRVKEMTGSSSDIVYESLPEDDPQQRRPDITKARTLLGWEPKTPLDEGLQKTITYFKTV